jgi:hypothetical protein
MISWMIYAVLVASVCWRSPKTDHLCALKIDQGWKPRERSLGVVGV